MLSLKVTTEDGLVFYCSGVNIGPNDIVHLWSNGASLTFPQSQVSKVELGYW